MNDGTKQVICGSGKGKTTAALGMGITALTTGSAVIMIQFLKGSQESSSPGFDILKRLEPEFKIFRFEKSRSFFEELSIQEKEEERINILNGLNFAKKVLTTGECDLLILDELLGLLDQNIITMEECIKLLESKAEGMKLIITGNVFPKELESYIDSILEINHVKVDNRI